MFQIQLNGSSPGVVSVRNFLLLSSIQSGNAFVLTQDIPSGGGGFTGTCIVIDANDIVIDGQGHQITGNPNQPETAKAVA